MHTTRSSSRRNRKIAAVAAGALAVGLGAAYTLASWTDSEWVWGGAAGDEPGIGTGTFEVEQFTEGSWRDDETNPGGALDFTTAALALAPGDTVYAPVSLRTKTGSLGGEVTLSGAVAAQGITVSDAGQALWNAVELTVHTSAETSAPACAAGTFDAADWTAVDGIDSASLGTGASAAQALAAATDAAPGAPQHYCFVISLPADAQSVAEAAGVDLMGRTIAPAWEFAAVSG
ncbi:SipW-dependent-type signal peptide-containing protein [Leucobacter massiliensis]|uniref:Uncharacterized protein n=1 Tax=Leucobacter massiliensis TaxID=1686285 RepID=A0A2S9QN00_9MICO|nr:SipW-dependent-type signal peptide-containing protein [Leucobacter massiliensis]PRI10973.1 hypothetical protein B4915_08800 [Leucobacter massiliensis]